MPFGLISNNLIIMNILTVFVFEYILKVMYQYLYLNTF